MSVLSTKPLLRPGWCQIVVHIFFIFYSMLLNYCTSFKKFNFTFRELAMSILYVTNPKDKQKETKAKPKTANPTPVIHTSYLHKCYCCSINIKGTFEMGIWIQGTLTTLCGSVVRLLLDFSGLFYLVWIL